MTLAALEMKDDEDPIETKEDELEARFTEYHEATKSSIEEAHERFDELEERLNLMSLSGRSESGTEKKEKAEFEAFGNYIKTGSEEEIKSLSAGDDTAGGFLVGTNLSTTINQKIFDQSPIRRLARNITITQGTEWSEPTDFDDVGAEWTSEKGSRTETDNPNLGMLTIPLNEIYAHQTVTQTLLDLSFVDIGGWINGKIADKFGRTMGLAYASGNGVGKPRGFLDYPTDTAADGARAAWTLQHVVSGSATTIADAEGQANGLKDLYWSLRAPYRSNASWLMASATANALDNLKDANGQPIWRTGMTAGAPPSLLGRPVEFDENMPAIGAGANPVAFGDFSAGYTVVDWSGIKPLRDPFTNKPNVIFYVYRRSGGGLSNPDAIKLLKISA